MASQGDEFTGMKNSENNEAKEPASNTAGESGGSNGGKGTVIEENTYLHLILKHWVPPLITALVGGLMVAIILPRFQEGFEASHANQERRQEILESTIKNFAVYIESWRRLRTIAEYESEVGKLKKEEEDRKNRYVAERDAARNSLFSDLATAGIYYKQETIVFIREFQTWDREQATKSLHELRPLREWEDRRDGIVAQMTQEVAVK
jgi:hypothetical protein